MRYFLFFSFFFLIPTMSIGQLSTITEEIKKSPLILELEVENGGILAQKGLKNSTYEGAYYNGLNFKVGFKQRAKRDQYYQIYNYPTYGIGLYSSTFNTDILGSPFAVYGFVQTPIAPKENSRWSYDYRIGLGLSGNFKPYNENENPLNLVIGSKNNVFIDLGIRTQYQINPHWKAGVGLAFHHFSNGALALPNKGVNLVPVTLSVNYQINPDIQIKRDSVLKPYSKKILYHLNYGVGFKQLRDDLPHRFFKTTLSAYASRHVSYKWRLGGGLDIFYSSSGNDKEVAGDKSGELKSKISGGPSFYVAHILNERLVLNGNVGYYIHNQRFNGEIKPIFLRAGARYYVYKNINAGVSIKAHMGKADFIEWTVGYTFNRDHD
ncbi:acyloxyacyl hydrolase [Sphingobacterium lactis]|uniref:Lipid A 3-O-deacylase (PagL) n=1 Tax=Sphingobacterium lactis TaxID=797291 RepID=A0A1H6CMP2_9SPHI|nr:acyloxyacyl hydrolase [Sphingobacterium lactis]SEG74232.1 Lipid A 3-O-deacylase (PagL) [Sphingobacterium lactis]